MSLSFKLQDYFTDIQNTIFMNTLYLQHTKPFNNNRYYNSSFDPLKSTQIYLIQYSVIQSTQHQCVIHMRIHSFQWFIEIKLQTWTIRGKLFSCCCYCCFIVTIFMIQISHVLRFGPRWWLKVCNSLFFLKRKHKN